jgi:hypothetical protein
VLQSYTLRGIIPVFVMAFGTSCSSSPDPRLFEEGVSETLAALRRGAVRDLSYTYELDVPASMDEPLRGAVVLRFTW